MRLRTVVHLLSGSIITSTWAGYTDAEFGNARYAIGNSLTDLTLVYVCLEAGDPPSIEREVYIPVRNIDIITIETTSDDNTSAIS